MLNHIYTVGCHNTKSFLNHVDSGVRTAKQLYTIVEPLIAAYAGGKPSTYSQTCYGWFKWI